jgi:hypothetical protein
MLTDRQRTLTRRFHVTRKKPYHMDELLSYVNHNGRKFRRGGSNLLSILREELGDEDTILLENSIYSYLFTFRNFHVSETDKRIFNKPTYRSKGILVFP